jgi:hypothetical protein
LPMIPTTTKTAAGRAAIFLVFSAIFTFAAAQYSWESNSNSGSDSEPAFNSAAEPSFESYDIGPYSSSKGDDSGKDAKKVSKDKPPKEKKQKAPRGKSFGPSFSSAFSGPQKSCPVCASVRLKNNQYVDYSGGRIHVCSAACIGRVRRNPEVFADILVKRGEQLVTP